MTVRHNFLSELGMKIIRTWNEKCLFLSELGMKKQGDTIVYHKYTIQLRRVRLTLPAGLPFASLF
jgi:hypothetical protein